MSRYIQKVTLAEGRVRWIGWEVDGVGTEIPGLQLADSLSEDELAKLKIRTFVPMQFEDFLGIGASLSRQPSRLHDDDLAFRLDHLRVQLDRLRTRGITCLTKAWIKELFSGVSLADLRIQQQLMEWENEERIQVLGTDECYIRIVGRFH